VPNEKRALGWGPLSVLGPMARTVPDLCLLLSCMVSDDARDPLAYSIAGKRVRQPADFAVPAPVDLAGLRVALTPDFGFAPTERHMAEVFAEKTGLFRPVLGHCEDTAPDCTGTDEVFETLRSTASLASHHDRVRDTPDAVGPNVHKDVAAGLRLSALDVAGALQQQTVLYRRWQLFFERFDVILSPAVTISPRPWSELFPSSIDGKPTRTYYNWLALAYAVTVVGHPVVSLPVGLDRNGMPFGLQIVGRRGGDAQVLAVAAALERLLAGDPRTARPVPNVAALAAAPPLSDTPGFLGFG
jgi:Asp-tRNA(Asn)/Glu-tRNA(Gln) amidotransferase A subunit family amidase